jgi:hypothetical protein
LSPPFCAPVGLEQLTRNRHTRATKLAPRLNDGERRNQAGSGRPGRKNGAHGELIGITLVNAKWLAERDGVLNVSFPIPADELVPAFA